MKTDILAKEIRKESIGMVYRAKASHIGGALSMADILAVLYNEILKINPEEPGWLERDRFLLSKGHACTSLYAVLAIKGYYPIQNLESYGQDGSDFICHSSHKVPGVELSSGSLGHALSVGCGIALAAKRLQKKFKTYVLVSDGELDEGSNWESILFAPHHKLDNLVLIIDYNQIQSLGNVKEVVNLEPIKAKFEAFNWHCLEIDGHDLNQIREAIISDHHDKPLVVIARTIKGKGVDFMEGNLLWHYKSPTKEEYLKSILNLK